MQLYRWVRWKLNFSRSTIVFPSSLGISLKTPLGRVIHTGDFKIDESPVLDPPIDLQRLQAWGDEGVLL